MNKNEINHENEVNENNKPFKDLEWINFKIAIKSMLLIALIMLSAFLIFGVFSYSITDDINYTFDNDRLFETPNDFYNNFNQTWNLRNETEITQLYNASYSFTEDPNYAIEEEIGFIDLDYTGINDNISIIPEFNGHGKVLKLEDRSNTTRFEFIKDFGYPLANDTHSFWIAKNTTNTNTSLTILFYENQTTSDELFRLYFEEDDIQYYNGSYHDLKINHTNANLWNYIRVIPNDYLNTVDVSIDGELCGINLDYTNPSEIGIERIKVYSTNSYVNYTYYLDAWNTPYRPRGEFQATYTFSNDTWGEFPNKWGINDTGGNIDVIKHKGDFYSVDHINIVQLEDESVYYCSINNTFSSVQTYGSIDFWISTEDISKASYVWGIFNNTEVLGFKIDNNDFYYWGGMGWENSIKDPIVQNDLWYHIRFDFRCYNAPEYRGLTNHRWKCFINGIDSQHGGYFGYGINVYNITTLRIRSDLTDHTYKTYIDAIGYSWDPNYYIEKNMIDPTKNYRGIYPLYNDITYTEPDNFTVLQRVNTNVDIAYQIGDHEKVLDLYDNNATIGSGGECVTYNYLPNRTFGTIEFWFQSNDTNKLNQILLKRNFTYPNLRFRLYHITGYFQAYNDTTGWENTNIIPLSNTWYHIRFDFRTKNGSEYLGLELGEFRVYINENLIDFGGDMFLFLNPPNLNILYLETETIASDYHNYYDAIGYSWDPNYNIGDNLDLIHYHYENENQIAYINRYDTLEVDRWEFALEGLDDQHELWDDDPDGWTDKNEGYDGVNVGVDTEDDIYGIPYGDRSVRISTAGQTTKRTWGVYKIFSETDYVYNVTFGLECSSLEFGTDSAYCEILSNDSSIIAIVGFVNFGATYMKFSYWGYTDGGTPVTWQTLNDTCTYNTYYEINLYINYYHQFIEVRLYEEHEFFGMYKIPFFNEGKQGISRVNLYGSMTDDFSDVICYFDYCGIYKDGISLYDGWGFAEIQDITIIDVTEHKYWNLEKNNLIRINASGEFYLYKHLAWKYGVPYYDIFEDYAPLFVTQFKEIEPEKDYTNVTLINGWDEESFFKANAYSSLVFYLEGSKNFSINSIIIEGVRLRESIDSGYLDYYLIFSHAFIDMDENYFYVEEGSDVLKWNYESDELNKTEYIQAGFDINDQLSINASVRFVGRHGGLSYGSFNVNYEGDLSSIIYLKTFTHTTNFLLPSEFKIINFAITVTDSGEDIEEITTGSIKDISLRFLPNYQVTITTIALLDILIPIIVLLLPTGIMYKKFGKNAIFPMLILMSIICLIGELIPIWLFFIMLIGFATILLIQRRRLGGMEG